MRNVHVENGSRGISVRSSDGALLQGISAKNLRGPYPAGQCVEFVYSDRAILDDFSCMNDP